MVAERSDVDFQTTQGYIREAEAVRAGFGDVFPELPPSVLGSTGEPSGGGSKAIEEGSSKSLAAPVTRSAAAAVSARSYLRGGRDSKPVADSDPAENKPIAAGEGSGSVAVSEAKSADPGPVIAPGERVIDSADAVEQALADALTRAATAGEWALVGQLSGELEARRRARLEVVDLGSERTRRKRDGK